MNAVMNIGQEINTCLEQGKPIQNEGEFEGSFGTEPGFICGSCDFHFDDIAVIHNHMCDHIEGGSYNYNHFTRTAFPLSLSKDASTQTDDSDASEVNSEGVSRTKCVKIKLLLDSFDASSSGQNKSTSEHIEQEFREVKAEISDGDETDDYDAFDLSNTEVNRTASLLGLDGRHDDFNKKFSTETVPQQIDETSEYDMVALAGTESKQYSQPNNKDNVKLLNSDKKFVNIEHSKSLNKYKSDVKKPCAKVGNVKNAHVKVGDVEDPDTKVGDVKDPHAEVSDVKDPHAKVECGICGKGVKKMNLRKHRRWVHERIKVKEKPVSCEQCGRSFPKLRNLIHHRKIHKGRYLTCCHCNQLFSSHMELIAHIKEHKRDKSLDVEESIIPDGVKPLISGSNAVSDDLENNTAKISVVEPVDKTPVEESITNDDTNTGKNDQPNQQIDNDFNSGDSKVNCEKCGAVTKKRYLRIHLIRFHGESKRRSGRKKKNNIDTNHRKVECHLCGKEVKKMNLRKHHRIVHEKVKDKGPAICEACGRIFPSPRHLAMHRKVHTDKYLTCRHCSYLSSTHEEFIAHLNEHNKARTFTCHVCGAVFLQSGRLSKHVRSVHMGEKRYFCDICSKGFYSKGNVTDHKRIHFEAALPCSYCDRKFKDPSSRKRHEKVHLGDHTYFCYICNRGFVQSGCYKSHMLKMHFTENKKAMEIHHESKAATK